MKKYTFRITQPLEAFYTGHIDVEASSEEEARNKLKKMSQSEFEDNVYDWEQDTGDAFSNGPIEVHELIDEE